MISLNEVHKALILKGESSAQPIRILGLDPGETTGFVLLSFDGHSVETTEVGQIKEQSMATAGLQLWKLIDHLKPDVVVMEDYRVYAWKTQQHAWASLFTPRLIGAIEAWCEYKEVPYIKQTAQVAKGFCTDDKLEQWGLWQSGQRHARDAIRHAVYYLLFGDRSNVPSGR